MYIMTIVVVVGASVVYVRIDAVPLSWGFSAAALKAEFPFLLVCVCTCRIGADMMAL